MPNNYDKLLDLLRELFQLDQAKELDFGIYRIIAQREKEISDFMEKDLLPQVKDILGETASGDNAAVQVELEKLVKTLTDAGMNPDESPKVKELKEKLGEGGDLAALENEVFSHLYSFFRRYYHQGDFISQRRYKEGVYAIPYEGEEVKLHWANADQYYIKTTENFRDFTFKLPSGKRVHFKLVDASTEQDNKKAQEGKDRRFKLYEESPLAVENEELVIRFVYEVDKTTQKKLTEEAVEAVLAATDAEFKPWIDALSAKAPTEKNKDRTLLEKHLTQYTARNTFDYFIHKDLKGFLSREMDFYIKNEMMHLDDIENESAPKVESYLCKVKAFRKIATQIITFLAQLEDFQKKLWLKKKFVVETNWCITLDHVLSVEDEKTRTKLLEEIAANDAQREEWVRLFAIDEIKADSIDGGGTKAYFAKNSGHIGYSEPLTNEFLTANRFLVLDTKFFSEEFRNTLLSSIQDLDKNSNGLLVQSDNFQAINLLATRLHRTLDCIYIDPPYNTDASPILYKNGYRHSSWVSLMSDRLRAAEHLCKESGTLCVAIDDYEYPNLSLAVSLTAFNNYLATAVIRSKPQGRPTTSGFSTNHEYAVFCGTESSVVGRLPREGSKADRYPHKDERGIYSWANFRKSGSDSNRQDRKRSFYPIFVSEDAVRIPDMTWNSSTDSWDLGEEPSEEERTVFPVDTSGTEKVWTCSAERAKQELGDFKVVKKADDEVEIHKKYRPNEAGALPGTWWDKAEYSASESGTKVLKDILASKAFDFPKSINLVSDCLRVLNLRSNGTVLDFFGGSGTTAHAVTELNRQDGGSRKYVLAEMGDHFDTALKPRTLKSAYAVTWKDGKPQLQSPIKAKHTVKTSETVSKDNAGQEQLIGFSATLEGTEVEENPEFEADNPFGGVSQIIKYIRLESYEDCLNNLQLTRTAAQTKAFEFGDEKVKREYMLSYMLDVESRGSLLNLEAFAEPDEYVLNIQQGDETVPTRVDLPETFNYLLGLRVKHVDVIRGVRVIEGVNPAGERVLVLWRNAKTMDSDKLDEWFKKQKYNTQDMEYDLIYVNGDNNLENLRKDEHTWKVRLIEQEFHRLMFDVEDV